jgi:hypothetical protein
VDRNEGIRGEEEFVAYFKFCSLSGGTEKQRKSKQNTVVSKQKFELGSSTMRSRNATQYTAKLSVI